MSLGIGPAQEAALATLARIIGPEPYYLAGGVAVLLRLNHRTSVDIDLFTATSDPTSLTDAFRERSVVVTSAASRTLHVEIGGVPASLLQYRYPMVAPLETVPGVPLPVASLDDLECMKLSAIAARGALRDFWDLHAMLAWRGKGLAEALSTYRRKYVDQDIGHVIRSLTYFADAEAEPLPRGLTPAHWAQVRAELSASALRL